MEIKKKLIKVNYYNDFTREQDNNIFLLKNKEDIWKVLEFIKKLQLKYWPSFDKYEAFKGISNYIKRTLGWKCIDDLSTDINI